MPPQRITFSLFTLLLLAAGCVAASSETPPQPDTSTPAAASPVAEEPTPTPQPGALLTPQPNLTIDLAEARRLESEGDLEAAARAYVAAAAREPAARAEATLSAARALLELERPEDVRVLLEPLAAGTNDGAVHYLLARAYAALGMWAGSVQQYDLYIRSGRPAVAYAYLDRGRSLLEQGQPAAAITSAQSGLALGPPAALRRSFLLFLAQANERAGNAAEAVRWYRALVDDSAGAGDVALALSRIAAIKREQGDPTYMQELERLLITYPSSRQALTDLNAALARGETIDPTVRGIIHYRHFDNSRAEAALREQVERAPAAAASATAYYYLGAVVESRDWEQALLHYARAAALNPGGSLADDALWWQARILEDAGRLAEARSVLERLQREYPFSPWASEATFRAGLLLYLEDRYREAAAFWARALASETDSLQRQRLSFWQAKALLRAGERSAATPILEQLSRQQEDDYYGVRARSLLRDRHDIPAAVREARVDLTPAFDWALAEAWLRQRTGRAIEATWTSDPRWLRAQELWLVGRTSQGDAEAINLIEAHAGDSIAMYTLSRALVERGRLSMSARAGQRLLRTLDTKPNAGLPKALLALSYPPAFGAMARDYAEAERISPLLLLAFIRQESFFDPRAESPAGALGLTQVLPETGRTIAARLGVRDFRPEALLTARTNLRFGASYMAQQLREFDNETFVALAAYNAGPNQARRWRRAAGKDADMFLETIDYQETRLYVQIVAENYAIYRYLYGGQPFPDLPD